MRRFLLPCLSLCLAGQTPEAHMPKDMACLAAPATDKPGGKVVVKWQRDGAERQAEAILKGR